MKKNAVLYLFILLNLLNFPLLSYADDVEGEKAFLTFQVVQGEFRLDNTDVKSASIIMHDNVFDGLVIELKSQAVADLARITGAGIGKRMNIVMGKGIIANTVIQAPLGEKLMIRGITHDQAQEFIYSLQETKPKM